jgi:hypothetical protein
VREPVCKVGRVWVSLVKVVAEGVEEGYVGRFERDGAGLLVGRRKRGVRRATRRGKRCDKDKDRSYLVLVVAAYIMIVAHWGGRELWLELFGSGAGGATIAIAGGGGVGGVGGRGCLGYRV